MTGGDLICFPFHGSFGKNFWQRQFFRNNKERHGLPGCMGVGLSTRTRDPVPHLSRSSCLGPTTGVCRSGHTRRRPWRSASASLSPSASVPWATPSWCTAPAAPHRARPQGRWSRTAERSQVWPLTQFIWWKIIGRILLSLVPSSNFSSLSQTPKGLFEGHSPLQELSTLACANFRYTRTLPKVSR